MSSVPGNATAQGQTPERKEAARWRIPNVQVHAVCLETILKVQLEQKDMQEFFWLGSGERSVFFVVTGIKVYIIIIMGQLKY